MSTWLAVRPLRSRSGPRRLRCARPLRCGYASSAGARAGSCAPSAETRRRAAAAAPPQPRPGARRRCSRLPRLRRPAPCGGGRHSSREARIRAVWKVVEPCSATRHRPRPAARQRRPSPRPSAPPIAAALPRATPAPAARRCAGARGRRRTRRSRVPAVSPARSGSSRRPYLRSLRAPPRNGCGAGHSGLSPNRSTSGTRCSRRTGWRHCPVSMAT